MYTKQYHFVKPKIRKMVDLTDYAQAIEENVKTIVPEATVTVHHDRFVIETPLPLSNTQARDIGRLNAQTELGQHCTPYIYNQGEGKTNQLFVAIKD